MEIRDCLPLMTKFYLSRIVDSIFKENIPKGSSSPRKYKPPNLPNKTPHRRTCFGIRDTYYSDTGCFGQKRTSHLTKAPFSFAVTRQKEKTPPFAPLPLRPSRLERLWERAVQFIFPAEHQAIRLKYRNETDTDIALITARDLKYLAENWPKFTKNNKPFDLNVFNTTGVLDRNTLDQRMKLLLG